MKTTNVAAQLILENVIAAMRDAEKIGGPGVDDYIGLMDAIIDEAKRRRDECAQQKTIMLDNGDGDTDMMSLETFIEANEFECESGGIGDRLRSLKVGESISEGGGAAPVWTATRLA